MKSFAVIAGLVASVSAVFIGNTDFSLVAGEPYTIEFGGAKGDSVQLILRGGDATGENLDTVLTIGTAPVTDGSGTLVWDVPSTLPGDGPYAFQIVDGDEDNYTQQFDIEGVDVAAPEPTNSLGEEETSASSTTEVPLQTTTSSAEETTTETLTTATSSFVTSSAAETTETTVTRPTNTRAPTSSNTPVPNEDKASGLASPMALILVTLAAMWFIN